MNEQSNNRKPKKKPTLVSPKAINIPVKTEVPLYDPQTGEANPLYEELTGKKNPLIESRKNPIITVEPKRKNRFLITFPKNVLHGLQIESWMVAKTQRPSIKVADKKFLGIKFGVKAEWEKISFEFIDPIGPSLTERLIDMVNNIKQPFDYTLEMLDPTGVTVERWKIEGCKIEAVSFGALDYADDGIARCYMLVKPTNVQLMKTW